MEISTIERRELDRMADEIERAFFELSLPVRVAGGRISAERICYQLAPLAEPIASQVMGASHSLGAAIGEPALRILREAQGLAIDVPRPADEGLRLLPLQQVVGGLPPMTALLGLAVDGRPFVQSFSHPSSWHLCIRGPQGCGKSEALRTVLTSLCLQHHPVELHVAGIDLGGRQLAVLEALPHAIASLASDLDRAADLLGMIAEEVQRRIRFKLRGPALILFIDELEPLLPWLSSQVGSAFKSILADGDPAGVHVFAAVREGNPLQRAAGMPVGKTVQIMPSVSKSGEIKAGVFDVAASGGRQMKQVELAWLPTSDLQTAVHEIQQVWSDGLPGLRTTPLSKTGFQAVW